MQASREEGLPERPMCPETPTAGCSTEELERFVKDFKAFFRQKQEDTKSVDAWRDAGIWNAWSMEVPGVADDDRESWPPPKARPRFEEISKITKRLSDDERDYFRCKMDLDITAFDRLPPIEQPTGYAPSLISQSSMPSKQVAAPPSVSEAPTPRTPISKPSQRDTHQQSVETREQGRSEAETQQTQAQGENDSDFTTDYSATDEESGDEEDPLTLEPPTARLPRAFGLRWPKKAANAMTKKMIDQFAELYDRHAASPQWNNYLKVLFVNALQNLCPPKKRARRYTPSHNIAEIIRNNPPHFVWAYFYLIIYQDEFLVGDEKTAETLLWITERLEEIQRLYDWEPSLDSPGPTVKKLQDYEILRPDSLQT